MDPRQARSLLIFGGTFDPPHRAHVELPELVRDQLGFDLILYIPAGVPPHKPDVELTDARHRLAMLQLALTGRAHTAIDTIELDHAASGEPTYTVDTLEALHSRYPGKTMRLLIGADQMHVFETWRNPKRIIELAEPAVMARGEDLTLPSQQWRPRMVQTPRMDISATELREALRRGEPISQWVQPDVARYIEQHRLYR